MTWMLTATGTDFPLRMPMPGAVDIFDIAWHLSQINRFTGACLRPFSVAEHSLLVCDIAQHELGLDVHGQLAALLHDAHKAYTGDVSSPVKQMLGDAWFALERHIEGTVRTALSTHVAMGLHGAAIKRAGAIAMATERRDLTRHTAQHLPWPILQGVQPLGHVNLRDSDRRSRDWEYWRDAFLDRYHALHETRLALQHGCSRHQPPAERTPA